MARKTSAQVSGRGSGESAFRRGQIRQRKGALTFPRLAFALIERARSLGFAEWYVSDTTLRNWDTGVTEPSATDLYVMAKFFGVGVSDLLRS